MFLVFNKDKIMAFAVACSTVFVLFLMSTLFTQTPENAIPTSSNQTKNEINNTPGNNVIENQNNSIENNVNIKK